MMTDAELKAAYDEGWQTAHQAWTKAGLPTHEWCNSAALRAVAAAAWDEGEKAGHRNEWDSQIGGSGPMIGNPYTPENALIVTKETENK